MQRVSLNDAFVNKYLAATVSLKSYLGSDEYAHETKSFDAHKCFALLDRIVSLEELRAFVLTENGFVENAKAFLAKRWERIQNTNCIYAYKTPMNDLCIALAEIIRQETGQTLPQTLMPTIKHTKDLSEIYDNLEAYDFDKYVMSDDNQYGLPVSMLVQFCTPNLDYTLYNIYKPIKEGGCIRLSDEEIYRLEHHSRESKLLFETYRALKFFSVQGNTFAARLRRLMLGLRLGGKQETQQIYATAPASLAIVEFKTYLDSLSSKSKRDIMNLREGGRKFEDTWNILIQNDKNSCSCVELASECIERILRLSRFELEHQTEKFKSEYNDALFNFKRCLSSPNRFNLSLAYALHNPKFLEAFLKFFTKCFYECDSSVDKLFQKYPFLRMVINSRSSFNLQLFLTAVRLDKEDMVSHFIKAKEWSYMTLPDGHGETAVSIAARFSSLSMLQLLIRSGFPVNSVNNKKYRPIDSAAELNKYEHVLELLVNKANPSPLKHSQSALHLAAACGHLRVVTLLLAYVPVNTLDNDNNPAIYMAAKNGRLEVLQLLISANACIFVPGFRRLAHEYYVSNSFFKNYNLRSQLSALKAPDQGNRALDIALKEQQIACAEELLAQGVNFRNVDLKKEINFRKIKFFDEPITPGYLEKRLDILCEQFKDHLQLVKLQETLWWNLKIFLANSTNKEDREILLVIKDHKIFKLIPPAKSIFDYFTQTEFTRQINDYYQEVKKVVGIEQLSHRTT